MRKDYPKYKRGELESIFDKLSPSEKKIINEYVSYCAITAAPGKQADIKRSIVQFRNVIEKNFDKITLEDLREFLMLLSSSHRKKYTMNGLKAYVKKFLRWRFKDWSERFDSLKDIKLQKGFNEERVNAGTLLKKEDIEKIMKAEPRLFWKTLFITLYESGCRPVEIRSLKWSDIDFNSDGEISSLNIYSTKTARSRVVYVKEATFFLSKLREQKDKSEYVFPSPREINLPLPKSTLAMWFKELGKKSIGREIFPYLLRHSRATELYTSGNISNKITQKFLGHSKDMSDVYTHLSSKDVKEALAKTIYQFEEMKPEQKHKLEKKVEILSKLVETLVKINQVQSNSLKESHDSNKESIESLSKSLEVLKTKLQK